MYPVNLMMKMCQVVIRQCEGYTQHKPEVVDYYEPFRDFLHQIIKVYAPRESFEEITRNVSIGHGCPRYCQIRVNRALSLTKGHYSNNNRWILSVIELDLYFMNIYRCLKYESNTPMYSKDITPKPFFIRRSRAITLIIIGGFYLLSNLTCIL